MGSVTGIAEIAASVGSRAVADAVEVTSLVTGVAARGPIAGACGAWCPRAVGRPVGVGAAVAAGGAAVSGRPVGQFQVCRFVPARTARRSLDYSRDPRWSALRQSQAEQREQPGSAMQHATRLHPVSRYAQQNAYSSVVADSLAITHIHAQECRQAVRGAADFLGAADHSQIRRPLVPASHPCEQCAHGDRAWQTAHRCRVHRTTPSDSNRNSDRPRPRTP